MERDGRNERNYYYGYHLRNASCDLLYGQEEVIKGGETMETLMKEISKLLENKNLEIYLLKAENERLCKENAKLIEDNEKHKENEVRRG